MRTFVIILFLTCACKVLQAQVNTINTIAGQDTAGFSGDGGLAINAKLNVPDGLCLDNFGNLYISDGFNNVIRKIHIPTGIITTIAGVDTVGFSGDEGTATNAKLYVPEAVFADTLGNVYIADAGNNRIRKVDVSSGIITTIAGSGPTGISGGAYDGDSGPSTNARLNGPSGVCLDKSGNIYIADYANNVVRKVDAVTSIITTIAGTGASGYSGDSNPATDATFQGPIQVFADNDLNILICDQFNHAIRKVDATTGIITTIAGNGMPGYTGDNGPATDAQLNQPCGVYVDKQKNIFIAEYGDGVIRRIDGASGIITTVAGTGIRGFSGDNGPATDAMLKCGDVFLDNVGSIYIADIDNNRIRKVYNPTLGVGTIQNNSSQQYRLVPNPNNGSMALLQSVTDADPVACEIWDAVGRSIYKQNILFSSNQCSIQLGAIVPGLYLLQLRDTKGQEFKFKFLVE